MAYLAGMILDNTIYYSLKQKKQKNFLAECRLWPGMDGRMFSWPRLR